MLLLTLVLPTSFVQNAVALNEFSEEPPPTPRNLDGFGEEGAGQSEGESDRSQNGKPLGEENYPNEPQGEGQGQGGGDQELDQVPNRGEREDERRGGGGRNEGEGRQPPQGGQGQGQGQGGQGQQEGRPRIDPGQGGQGQSQDGEPQLQGVPADQWNNYQKSGEGDGNQSAVMIIASYVDPIYAAESYNGEYDPAQGFVPAPPEEEAAQCAPRYAPPGDLAGGGAQRRPQSASRTKIYYLSSIKERVAAYEPYRIQPTVQDTRYAPFDLSYAAISRISMSTPEDWQALSRAELSSRERERFGYYLETNLTEESDDAFDAHLRAALQAQRKRVQERDAGASEDSPAAASQSAGDSVATGEVDAAPDAVRDAAGLTYFDKIEAILQSFEEHQYELGFTETMDEQHLYGFLTEDRAGDCSEFAAASAILARKAGIPSRVVTGYLASDALQTRAHVSGLYHLRKKIAPLQEFPLDELYLVTTSHRHAWVQFYIPRYGWVDFETTGFAIPPEPEMNPNNQDVIIPLIEEQEVVKPQPEFQFPWVTVTMIAFLMIALSTASLYVYRLVREWYYALRGRARSRSGLEARLTFLLMKLAREGYALKSPYLTPVEYARGVPAISGFAAVYTKLRFKERYQPGEQEATWQEFRPELSRSDRPRSSRASVAGSGPFCAASSVCGVSTIERSLLYRANPAQAVRAPARCVAGGLALRSAGAVRRLLGGKRLA